MNRKQFIESHGATCRNWRWSWTFVNHEEQFVIYGAWDIHSMGRRDMILSPTWQYKPNGKKQGQYLEARKNIRLIEEEAYALYTFPMIFSGEHKDSEGNGPAKMESFEPVLHRRSLLKEEGEWYAVDHCDGAILPDEIGDRETYVEGVKKLVSINTYERSGAARTACLEHYGYRCKVCKFHFEEAYGEIGKKYIHVHHIVPLHTIDATYDIDPINDLIPVCPNCHAMIHRQKPAMDYEELTNLMAQMGNFHET